MSRAERLARGLTLAQIEKLMMVSAGIQTFHARDAISINSLVNKDLVDAVFDLSKPDMLRGRVHEMWRYCRLTTLGADTLAACKAALAEAARQ